ncbi:MAG TPA: hypothetical protein VGK19_03005 [Capsulimonadaceae bacterium]|jgi:pyruvate,orthophosphate dikinase
MKQDKSIYFPRETTADMTDLVGLKAVNLAGMMALKLPVPPNFTVSTKCSADFADGRRPKSCGFMDEVRAAVAVIDHQAGRAFGDRRNPHLFAVRVGASVPSTHLMTAILNVGLNDETVEKLIELTGNPRFVYDAYGRLIATLGSAAFSNAVTRLRLSDFKHDFDEVAASLGCTRSSEMPIEALRQMCSIYKARIRAESGHEFPQHAYVQLQLAIEAGFRSWHGFQAVSQRRLANVSDTPGAAVTVQSMSFGNMGDDSGVGVCVASPWGGADDTIYGEFVPSAQHLEAADFGAVSIPLAYIDRDDPKIAGQIRRVRYTLAKSSEKARLFEFVVERGSLTVLRSRDSELTAPTAILSDYLSCLKAKQVGEFTMSPGGRFSGATQGNILAAA